MTADGELRLVAVQASDAGNYTCAVENTGGKDSITYYVSVDGGSPRRVAAARCFAV